VRFVDTNILIYAISDAPEERTKRDKATALLTQRDLALSTQVLQEFYTQTTRMSRPDRLSHEQAAELLTTFTRFPIQHITPELVFNAVRSHRRFGLAYWDAAIIEAARLLGCEVVLSEDMAHGEDYDGVGVVNPFR